MKNDLGDLHWYLAIKVVREDGVVFKLSQEQYVKAIIAAANLPKGELVAKATPETEVLMKLTKDMGPQTEEEKKDMALVPYRQILGMLMYLMVCCRPDIMHACKMLAQFCTNPGKQHWTAMKRVLRYLAGTADLELCLRGGEDPGATIAGSIRRRRWL